MVPTRRKLLKAGAALLALIQVPGIAFGAVRSRDAFEATDAREALVRLLGTDQTTPSELIALTAPSVAEDGTIVPITITTTLPDVNSISIVVANNPRPLAVSFDLPGGTLAEVACRIKMAETSEVKAVVHSENGIFSASTSVKVTLGGCA